MNTKLSLMSKCQIIRILLLLLFLSGSANAQEETSRFYIKNIDKTLDEASLVFSGEEIRARAYSNSMLKGVPRNLILHANNIYEFFSKNYGISRTISQGSWRKDGDDIYIMYEGDEVRAIDNDDELILSLFKYDGKEIFVYFDKENVKVSPVEPKKSMPYIGTYVSYDPEITVYKFNKDGTFIFSTKTGIVQSNIAGKYTYSHENGVEKISVKSNSRKGSAIVSLIDDKTVNEIISIAWKIDNYYERIFHKSPNRPSVENSNYKPNNTNPLQGLWYYSQNKSELTQREYFLIDKNGNRFVNEKAIDGDGYSFYPDGEVSVDYSTTPFQIELIKSSRSTVKGIFEFITEDIMKMELFYADSPQSNSFSLNNFKYYRATKDNTVLPCAETADNMPIEDYDILMEPKRLDDLIKTVEANLFSSWINYTSNSLEQEKLLDKYNKSQRAANRSEIKFITNANDQKKNIDNKLAEVETHRKLHKQAYSLKVIGAVDMISLAYKSYSSVNETLKLHEQWADDAKSNNSQIINIVIPQLDTEIVAGLCSINPSPFLCLGIAGAASLKYVLDTLAFEHTQLANDVVLYKKYMENFIGVTWKRGYRAARRGDYDDLGFFQTTANTQSEVMSGWVLRLICGMQEASTFTYTCNNPTNKSNFLTLLDFEELKDEFVFGYDRNIDNLEEIYNASFGAGLKPYGQLTPILSSKFIDIYNAGWARGVDDAQLKMDAERVVFKGDYDDIETSLYEVDIILGKLENGILCNATGWK